MVARIALLIAAVIAALASLTTVLAHDAVRILSQYQGANTVVVNYNVDHFQEGVPTRFDFRLYQIADGKPLEFDRVEARFVEGKVVRKALALPMSQDLDATYTYTFETHGDYGLQVEFVRGPNRLATAEFPLVVEALSRDNPAPLGALQLALAFGLGAVTIEVARGLGLGGKLLGGSRTRA